MRVSYICHMHVLFTEFPSALTLTVTIQALCWSPAWKATLILPFVPF